MSALVLLNLINELEMNREACNELKNSIIQEHEL